MPEQVANLFLKASASRMQLSEKDINRCLDKLSDEQMWRRGADHENSIGNLLLHLEGNMRQWFLHGIGGQPDVRQRDAEFTLSPSYTSAEVRSAFTATLAQSRSLIASLPPERLLELIDPQPGDLQRLPGQALTWNDAQHEDAAAAMAAPVATLNSNPAVQTV